MDILEQIIETKRQELSFGKRRSLKQALLASETGIIAEFKRKSPSKGWIHADAFPEEVVPAYAAAGATALSILTDQQYFGGSLDFIRRVRPLVDIPILRKDFIIDPYQLYQAREAGADAVLLIAACLSREAFAALLAEAHRLGLEVLLEVHSPEELDYIMPDVDVVGVNNRHLGSFVTDVQTSFDMMEEIRRSSRRMTGEGQANNTSSADLIGGSPSAGLEEMPDQVGHDGMVFISESGISSPDTVRQLREAGYRGFLMGENFMKQPDPGAALADFIQAI